MGVGVGVSVGAGVGTGTGTSSVDANANVDVGEDVDGLVDWWRAGDPGARDGMGWIGMQWWVGLEGSGAR